MRNCFGRGRRGILFSAAMFLCASLSWAAPKHKQVQPFHSLEASIDVFARARMTAKRVLAEWQVAADPLIFGLSRSQLRLGVVDGLTRSNGVLSRDMTAVTLRVMRGEWLSA